jgi:hypothetical protein
MTILFPWTPNHEPHLSSIRLVALAPPFIDHMVHPHCHLIPTCREREVVLRQFFIKRDMRHHFDTKKDYVGENMQKVQTTPPTEEFFQVSKAT